MVKVRARALAAVLVLLLVPSSAFAQDSVDEARQQAERAESQADAAQSRAREYANQATRVEDRMERLQSRTHQVEAQLASANRRLDAVEPKLEAASIALAEAQEESEAAAERAERARLRAEHTQAELERALALLQQNEDQRASVARNAYMYGPGASSGTMAVLELAEGTSPTEISDLLHMLDVLLVDHAMLVDESVRLAEDAQRLAEEAKLAHAEREAQATRAEAARDRAAQRHSEMMALMAEAEDAVTAQQQAMAQLEHQREVARKNIENLRTAQSRAEGEAAARLQDAANAAERADELAAQLAAARRAAAPTVSTRPINGSLTSVGGITVASSIAGRVEAMLKAARADGIVLGGYGYRSVETTIRLRRANGCPDVYSSPPSSCRVPTARPGTSMHEQGLAIDFTYQGRTLCYPNPPSRCYGNPAFDWLRAHAPSYGLYGLSSEAWHFSTNGR